MTSRRTIAAIDPTHTVTVGWDNPMTTFFAQVVRQSTAEEIETFADVQPLLWVGVMNKEILVAATLRDLLARYAVLTDGDIAMLDADRAADLDRGPTPLQRLVGKLFE